MTMTAVTYDELRPGCYERDARVKDFELNWTDGSLPFPTFPRFCGQTFYERKDKDLHPQGARILRILNDLFKLKEGGRMAIPVGGEYQTQDLKIFQKTGQEMKLMEDLPVRFVPMTGEARGE